MSTSLFSLRKTYGIPNDMFSDYYANENYLESGIELLGEVNRSLTDKVKDLYQVVSEANNVSEENNAMRVYVKDIITDLNNLVNKMDVLAHKFCINIANYISIAQDTIDDLDSIGDFEPYQSKYIEFFRDKLQDPEFPNMHPYAIFEKEFDFIGQLMQELPVTASYKDKIAVMTTVYNNFSNMTSSSINDKIYSDLFNDSDNCGNSASITSRLYSLFRGESKITSIDVRKFLDAKECISYGDNYIKGISNGFDRLKNDLKRIIESLASLCLDSQNNKLKINTKTDGIKNAIYSLDTYSSNKLLVIIKSKISQIIDVYNKYILVMSIKMNSIVAYVQQSCDIINFVQYSIAYNNDNTSDTEPKFSDDTSTDIETPDIDDDMGGEEPENDDIDSDFGDEEPDSTELENESSDDEPDYEEYSIDDDEEESDSDDANPDFDVEVDEDVREAVDDFYMALYEYERICETEEILKTVHTTLLEADDSGQPAGSGDGGKSTTTTQQTQGDNSGNIDNNKLKGALEKISDEKQSAWKKVINKLVGAWKIFREKVLQNYEKKAEFLKSNEKYIKMPKIDHEVSMPVIKPIDLGKFKIPEFNYSTMKNNLGSEEDFIKSQPLLRSIVGDNKDGKPIGKAIMDSYISPSEKITNSNQVEPMELYNYCKNYPTVLDALKKLNTTIEKGERNANRLAAQLKESAAMDDGRVTVDDLYFFNEKFESNPGEDNGGEDKSPAGSGDGEKTTTTTTTSGSKDNDELGTHLKVYFGTCGKVITGVMTTAQRIFDEYYGYLVWHIKQKKKTKDVSKSDAGNMASDFS